MPRFTLDCDDRLAARIRRLAIQYGLTEQEVLEQLIDVGLEELD